MTPKQERFAQAVADGMSQADAYRVAFDVKATTKPETVQQSACRLMANPKVAARVKELQAALTQKGLWTREMSVKALVRAFKIAEASANASGMTGAVKELNAMHGFNEPIKVEHGGSVHLMVTFG